MGLFISKLMNAVGSWTETPARVIMVGLDAAGKTTVMVLKYWFYLYFFLNFFSNRPEVLYKLKLNEVVTTIPTIGFNVEQVQPVPGLNLTVWDIGGQTKIRPLWRHYFQNTHGIIWIVDSSDTGNFHKILPSSEKFLG